MKDKKLNGSSDELLTAEIEKNHLSNAELTLLREPDETDVFESKRDFNEDRVRRQLAKILHNTSWWKRANFLNDKDRKAISNVEEHCFLAGPGIYETEEDTARRIEETRELREAYEDATKKIRLAEEAEISRIIQLVKQDHNKIFKGEEVHVLDGTSANDKVVGRIDRGIAEKFGFIHETANVVLITPEGKVLLQLRNKSKFDDHLAMYGGHLGVGESHGLAAINETKQETGLEKLESYPVFVAYEEYNINEDTNKERISWFVKVLREREYKKIKDNIDGLKKLKESKDRADVKAELFKLQKEKKDGSGEVIGIYPFPIEAISEAIPKDYKVFPWESVRSLTVHDTFKGKDMAIDAYFTPDSLDRLVSSEVWPKIIDAATREINRFQKAIT